MAIISAHIVPHPPIIIPEIGQGRQLDVQNTVNAHDKIAKKITGDCPETIIIITPHGVSYSDYNHISPGKNANGSLKQFGFNKNFYVDYDCELVEKICGLAEENVLQAGTNGEVDMGLDHGFLVPLYFLEKHKKSEFKTIRICLSGQSLHEHYKLGICIRDAINMLGRKAVIIASGDLSHKLTEDGPYGFSEYGPVFDHEITKAMSEANFEGFLNIDNKTSENAAECGLRSFVIMAGALEKAKVKAEFLSYEGTFGVGYALCSYAVLGLQEESEPVQLARDTLETYIKTGKIISDYNISEEYKNRSAGVFVSLKKCGQLRGCIGTIMPTCKNIAEEIIQNAVSSGTKDPRFHAVTENELANLTYSVDILSASEPIQSLDELDVKKYGVIVQSGFKRGLLLPNLEGIDTVTEQVSIALQKAGISKNEQYKMERFEVVRYK